MKIETVKQTKSFVEVSLPYFTQTICHQFKVISETECIQVCTLTEWESIKVCRPSQALGTSTKKSTELNFKKSFDKIAKHLAEKIK